MGLPFQGFTPLAINDRRFAAEFSPPPRQPCSNKHGKDRKHKAARLKDGILNKSSQIRPTANFAFAMADSDFSPERAIVNSQGRQPLETRGEQS
jgi:hypothetical protein